MFARKTAPSCKTSSLLHIVRQYHNLSTPTPDPVPWKSHWVSDIHCANFNPLGTAVKPPMPIFFLPGLTQSHMVFSNIVRHLNYPYGAVAIDLRGRGQTPSYRKVFNSDGSLNEEYAKNRKKTVADFRMTLGEPTTYYANTNYSIKLKPSHKPAAATLDPYYEMARRAEIEDNPELEKNLKPLPKPSPPLPFFTSHTENHKRPGEFRYSVNDYACEIIRVLNDYQMESAFFVVQDVASQILLHAIKRFTTRIGGIIFIDSGYVHSDAKHKALLRNLYDDLALHTNPSIKTPEAYAAQFGVTNFTELPKSTQEMFKQYSEQTLDAHQLKLDIQMLTRLHDIDHWMRLKIPMALVRAEHGIKENSRPYMEQQESQYLEKQLAFKDSYVAKGATHYNMLWNDEHCKAIAKLIDRLVGKYDIHRWVEAKFEVLKYAESK